MPATTGDRPRAESLPGRLWQAVAAAQAGDPLAPVDVVVPTALAGVTLRRASAGPRGWANVRFSTLPQLAERLCLRSLALQPGPLLRPLRDSDRGAAVREVLDEAKGDGRLLAAARRQRETASLLGSVFAELDDADVLATPSTSGLGRGAQDVLELYRLYRDQVTGLLTSRDLLVAAAAAVRTGAAPATHVVLLEHDLEHDRSSDAEDDLLRALSDGRRLTVLPLAEDPPAVSHLLVAPDAEEEVRIAIRTTLDQLARTSCRPERIGIAYVSATPYARLLVEQLTVAGVPHHAWSQQTLGQTVAGRVVQGLLSLHARAFPRADVLRWMADGPLLDAAGVALPVARWERLSRDAGVSRGLDIWEQRLSTYAEAQCAKAVERPDHSDSYARRAADALALLTEVQDLHRLAGDVLQAVRWQDAADSGARLLRRTLGPRPRVDRWSSATHDAPVALCLEQQAYDTVLGLLQALRDTPGPVSPSAIRDALDEGLSASLPSGTTLGRGVLIGPVRSFAGADLDLLLVLGCAEDSLPGRQRESALLRDADRVLLSRELATVASRRADTRTRWDSALRAASTVHLSYPRADTRAQRRQFASPWFLDQARLLHGGTPVTAAQVDEGHLTAPWLTSSDSFDASLRNATTYASEHELDVAITLRGGVDALASTDVRLARGLEAARARASGTFDAWSGSTGPLPEELRLQIDGRLSATSMQDWATCPASHLFGAVLGVRPLEDRAAEDKIDPRDKGNLVHGVLEKLLRPHLRSAHAPGIAPDTSWTAADIDRAVALLEADADVLTKQGLTGREVLWTAQLARLRRSLVRVLAHDSALRRELRSTPVAVEAAFGRQDVPRLEIVLPTQGSVPFAGSIDRIDVTDHGSLVVVDYKTGKGHGYDSIPKHPHATPEPELLDRGRKLQLLLYGLAARKLQGLPEAEVQAWFWFVELGALRRGGPVSAGQEKRLGQVLDVVVSGIRSGVYPANPGPESWRSNRQGFKNCTFCAFDLVCPTTRAEQWAGLAGDPAVRPYADLVDPSGSEP